MSESSYIEIYQKEIITTVVIVVIFFFIRFLLNTLVVQFGKKSGVSKPRIKMVSKYIDLLLFALSVVTLIAAWGVESKQAFLFISSIFTVIGVAMFAQWSILSNVTAGIIVFFAFPFRIGDKIHIIDKDNPVEAEIIDIRSFYTLLKMETGEKISYPNNLLLQKGVIILKRKNI